MTGLEELRARAESLRWAADRLATLDTHDPIEDLRNIAQMLDDAAGIVARDYAAAEEEEPPPQEDAEPEPDEPEGSAQPSSGEALALAVSAGVELARERLTEAQQRHRLRDDAEPSLGPAPAPTPPAVIRAWAQNEGMPINPRGFISTEALERVNARRAELRLAPFAVRGGEG